MMEHVYLLKVVINVNVHSDGKERTVLIKLILVMVRDESLMSHIGVIFQMELILVRIVESVC